MIEFNPLTTTDVQLPPGATFVVINSLVEANKAAGIEFNQRVAECRLATKVLAKRLNLHNWSELAKLKEAQTASGKSLAEMIKLVETTLHEHAYTIDELCEILEMSRVDIGDKVLTPNTKHLELFKLYQRAHHVYSEAARVYEYQEICKASGSGSPPPLEDLGNLMFDSHESCSKSYECSHPKLDELVELARKHGAYGARLTGAGWGGCIVALVPEAQKFIDAIKEEYFFSNDKAGADDHDSHIFPSAPCAGAKIYNYC